MELTFLGAAGNVTGSCYLLRTARSTVLIDCGMYQEREFRSRNWDPFPFPAAEIDALLLTHAHLDHCGRIPRLVQQGFRGPIYATRASGEIARIVLQDAGKLQEEDARYKKKRHEREGRKGPYPEVPLYTKDDAIACFPQFQVAPFEERIAVADGVEVEFREVGHILGAASIRVLAKEADGTERKVLFSGDLGRWEAPILRDPTSRPEADYVIMESTYGNRVHEDNRDIPDRLAEVINRTYKQGGNILIPSFAVERSQDVLYHLNRLLSEKRIPPLMVFVDSPMAIRVTEVFKDNADLFDEEAAALLKQGKHPCDFPSLSMCRTVAQSKAINQIKGSVCVIAGSGMCTGGRIKHHLVHNIRRPESVVLFVGYQAFGTLGRHIVDGADEVRILGRPFPVKAGIERIEGFSGHADRNELMRWLSSGPGKPKKVFLTHGEPEAAQAMAEKVAQDLGCETAVPAYQDRAVLGV